MKFEIYSIVPHICNWVEVPRVYKKFWFHGFLFFIHRPYLETGEFTESEYMVSEWSTGSQVIHFPERTIREAIDSAIFKLKNITKRDVTDRIRKFSIDTRRMPKLYKNIRQCSLLGL